MQILLIESRAETGNWWSTRLRDADIVAIRAGHSEQSLIESAIGRASAVLIDAASGSNSSIESIRAVRSLAPRLPILLAGDGIEWEERIACLEAGADFCLDKPVRAEEAVAWLRTSVRRAAGHAVNRIAIANMELDLGTAKAWQQGQLLALTRNEFRLLQLLFLNKGRALSTDEVRNHLHVNDEECGRNAIDVLFNRLRKKIGREWIRTVRNVGYRLEAPALAA